jgi:Grx4 family monothiol glutaredoxin
MMATTTTVITDDTSSDLLLQGNNNNKQQKKKYVILFTAEWHEACAVDGPMVQLLHALQLSFGTGTTATTTNSMTMIAFARCDAEDCPKLVERFNVTSVPTFVLVDEQGHLVEQTAGDDAAAVTLAVQRLVHNNNDDSGQSTTTRMMTTVVPVEKSATVNSNGASSSSSSLSLKQRLEALLRSSPVMVFIKGSPTEPQCGFSRQIVELLQQSSIAFGYFDILQDEQVRQGLKDYANWPTYPQLYVNGQLIGGLDIVQEMVADADNGGDLATQLGVTKQPSLHERLQGLIGQSPVVVFMKGLPSAPRCGFSRQLIELLDSVKAPYDTFDILSDESVREGLKTYSNWPTFPQLYIKGELIGGLDIAKEMMEDGSLQDALQGIMSSS